MKISAARPPVLWQRAVQERRGHLVESLESRIAPALTNPFPLGSVDGAGGFHFSGLGASGFGERPASVAGDVNGDGFDDVIFGASGINAAFVVFGKADGFSADINLTTLDGANGFRIDGTAASTEFGQSVGPAGDVNGDGFADIVVGAFNEKIGTNNNAGAAYVIFGKASFTTPVSIASLNGPNGFKLSGVAAFDQAGSEVGTAGDLNGDGFDEVVVGALGADPNGSASGAAYVVFGRASGFAANLSLSSLNGFNGFRLEGSVAGNFFGANPSRAGDVNGDGLDDLIVGAQGSDVGGADAGAAYVIFGRTSFAASLDSSGLVNSGGGFRVFGAAANDAAGAAVAGGGDVNGDGFADVVVGAFGSKVNGANSGAAYVIFGKATPFISGFSLSTLNGSNGFRLLGEAGGVAGYSVHLADDVNGDGFDDVIIGAPSGSTTSTYLVYGQPTFVASSALASLDGTTGVKFLRAVNFDSSGSNVSGGDVNGDGLGDIVSSDFFGGHVIFGSPSPAVTQLGHKTANTLTGTGGGDIFVAGQANDALLGNGGADVLRGGQGDDFFAISDLNFRRLVGGLGLDTLRLDGAGVALNLTTLSNLRLTGFERIDITGSGANTLTLSVPEVLNLSPTSNTLTVIGDADDFVTLGTGWVREVNQAIDGAPFHIFTNGAATLRIAETVSTSLASGYALPVFDGTLGFTINGVAANDAARVVARAGDVNGDGFDDFLIGAPNATLQGTGSGAAYVAFGRAGGFTSPLELSTLDGSNGFAILSEKLGDFVGFSLSDAGDFNGDGFGDLILGSRNTGSGSPGGSGAAYVIYGKAGPFAPAIELAGLDGANGFKIRVSDPAVLTGINVASVGDVNGDGFGDVVIGAPNFTTGGVTQKGAAYVLFGRAANFQPVTDLIGLNGANGFIVEGTKKFELLGLTVSGGDVNGDGFSDVILGTSTSTTPDAVVVFGKASGFTRNILDTAINGANGFTLTGGSAESVSAAGDVNGDGIGDLIVGAPFRNFVSGGLPGTNLGGAFVVFGKLGATFGKNVNLATLNGSDGFFIQGAASTGYAGQSVSAAGDVNGDGFDDVILGAAFANTRGSQTGEAYVVYGAPSFAPSLNVAALDGTNGFSLIGTISARTGQSVSGAGDVNGDGFDDVLVGSYGVSGAGRDYLIFGFDSGKVTELGGPGADTLPGGTAGVDVLVAGQGSDALQNIAFQDVARGGQGDDTFFGIGGPVRRLVGGHGFDTDVLGGNLILDLTARPVYRITGIEQVDLRPGANAIALDARAVVNLSPDTNTLIVRANLDDIVNIGAGWTATGSEVIDGDTFTVLTQGAAILKVSTFIAPIVTLVDAKTATYTDVDGDLVTIKTTKATLGLSDFFLFSAGTVGGVQLAAINFADDGAEFQGADLTITAARTTLGGDGRVNVGRIEASGVDLGKVTVAGDLRAISAGDATFATTGLAELNIGSMGLFGLSTQGANGLGFSVVQGKIGLLEIETDLVDSPITAVAFAGGVGFGAVKIGGSVQGGNGAFTGLLTGGSTGAISIGQDLRGGSGSGSGGLFINGSIASLSIGGSIVGGSGERSGSVFAQNALGAVKIGGDLDRGTIAARAGIASLAIDGSVLNARVLAGYNSLVLGDDADATIGAVTVGGDWVASSLVAGVVSSDPFFGNGGETLISSGTPAQGGGDPTKIAKITSITIKGQAIGTPGGTDHFGFVAEEIDAFTVGGTKFPLTSGKSNDLTGLDVGATIDVKVREVNATALPVEPPFTGPGSGFDLQLSTLNGSNGFEFAGTDAVSDTGRTVDAAGDVNNDGFGDFIVGSRGASPGGRASAGEAYIVFGKASGFPATFDANALDGANGFRIQGSVAIMQLGVGAGGAGDFNNDGFDDVIVGAIDLKGLAGSDTSAFVIFGKASFAATPTINVGALNGSNGVELRAPHDADAFVGFQMGVSGAGDLNNDGFDDAIVGVMNADNSGQTSGAVYVVFGRANSATTLIDMGALSGSDGFRFDSGAASVAIGSAVSEAGDINGDGVDDIVLGAHNEDLISDAGTAYVIFGQTTAFPAMLGRSALNGTTGFRIFGEINQGALGFSVNSAGDVNGDGVDDLGVGAPYASLNGTYSGATYVLRQEYVGERRVPRRPRRRDAEWHDRLPRHRRR